jgi:mono/diheme cytochrome c family protein
VYAVCGDCGWPRIYVAGAGRSSRRHSPVPIGIFVDADGRTRISAPSGAERPQSYSATEDNLIAGGKIYLNECAGCHGAPGKPNEPDALNPAAPRLAQVGTAYSEAQIFWVAKHGIRRTGMFANGVWDSDQKLWTVAAYIHRIKNLPPRVRQEIDKGVPVGS